MTVITGRREMYAGSRRAPMYTALEQLNWTFERDVVLFHQIEVLVTFAASLRHVDWVYARMTIYRWQYVVRAMATLAARYVRTNPDL